MIDQEEIHVQCFNENPKERLKALDLLKANFSLLPNKQQAWEDLHKFTEDEEDSVRLEVTNALRSVFSQVSDKQQAWEEAWEDLARLTSDQNDIVSFRAADTLVYAISQLPDKQQAWSYLHELADVQNDAVRSKVADFLGPAFSHLPDKQQAWEDLHKLTEDEDGTVRYQATCALDSAFSDVPNKQQAWNDLHRLSNDEECWVRSAAACTLSRLFSHIPDKQQAWNDLHRLANDQDSTVRYWTAGALGSIFSEVPDKQQAWSDLIKLTNDQEDDVRSAIANYLGSACSQMSDKQKVLNDLHRLTYYDQDTSIRYGVADALGFVFSQVPDKFQVLKDLFKLTSDQDDWVRIYANYSLGKIYVFATSQTENEEDYKRELENAIEFFENSSKKSSMFWDNPSQFCFTFYRSFHTILFKNQEAKEEVDKYLAEAKDAVKGSKSRELLFEAVENLANALKEVQNLENLDLEAKKVKLNFYRQCCDRAAELMKDTEEKAPSATEVLKKGLPILDRSLKELLEEIHKKAKIACKESKGTATEEIARTINSEIQKWEISSQEEIALNVENLIFTLESSVPRIPENQYIFNRIQQIREQKDVSKQYGIISTIIPLIPKLYMEQTVGEIKNDIKEIKEKVDYVTISLKPGIKEEIEISVGTEILGTGATHKIIIPLQEISYSELKEDLEKITGMKIDKLSKMPKRLANKVKGYLLLHDKDDILDKLT